jgi:hypothetical protein
MAHPTFLLPLEPAMPPPFERHRQSQKNLNLLPKHPISYYPRQRHLEVKNLLRHRRRYKLIPRIRRFSSHLQFHLARYLQRQDRRLDFAIHKSLDRLIRLLQVENIIRGGHTFSFLSHMFYTSLSSLHFTNSARRPGHRE